MFPTGDDATSKAAWRKAFKQVLSEVPVDAIESQSLVATQALQNLAVYEKATSISVFLSMPGAELQTTGIVEHALRSGKRVFVPYITRKPPVMEMLQLENEHDFKSLKPDKWGIPSLDAASIEARTNCFGHKGVNSTASSQSPERGLDLILMPAVAFDQSFDRLGHGKGYYDRFLTRYKAKIDQDCSSLRQPYLIGLALDEQILNAPHKLPAESWDVKVDAILVGGELRHRVAPP